MESLRNGREQWWLVEEEMKKEEAKSHSRQLFKRIKKTGIENPSVCETISGKDGTITQSQSRRWAERFRK